MARKTNKEVEKALEMYKKGMKLVDIANQLNLPAGTIRRWKSVYKWDNERSDENETNVRIKRNSQKNKNALKHGLFSKYLPKETLDIVQAAEELNPIDLLWDSIQIQYASIIKAQKIMCKNKDLNAQMNFLNSQARVMTSLQNMIKNYDELIHKNWDMATEEQKVRIEIMKLKIKENENKTEDNVLIDMLKGLKN